MIVHHMTYVGEYTYARGVVIHIFSNSQLPPEELVKIINELGNRYFSSELEEGFWHIGYEKLPIDFESDQRYYVIVSFDQVNEGVKSVISNVPVELSEKILQHRRTQVTVDLDIGNPLALLEAVNTLSSEGIKDIQVYETIKGYHVRGILSTPTAFERILEIRAKAQDDKMRIKFDERYLKAGLAYLTNFLFNAKAWWSQDGWVYKEWKEVDPEKEYQGIEITRKLKKLKSSSPQMLKLQIEIPARGNIEIHGNIAIFRGKFTNADADKIVTVIEDNLREYFRIQKQEKDLTRLVAKTYSEISRQLSEISKIIRKCQARKEHDAVVVYVPKEFSKEIETLLRKREESVKAVESELGVKLKIVQEETPEEVELKKKLENILKQIT